MRYFVVALSLCLLFLTTAYAQQETTVKRDGEDWWLENQQIRVIVSPAPGTLSVLDKRIGYEWRQPTNAKGAHAKVKFRRTTQPPKIDGDLSDWTLADPIRITHLMLADAKKVDDDSDCSAQVWCVWDSDHLYIASKVRDDNLQFGPTGLIGWWAKDALELWVGPQQVGLNLSPSGCQARTARDALSDARVAMRVSEKKDGYSVEAELAWTLFRKKLPRAGHTFPFAVGVNDADATARREGQIYFPATWRHSQPATFANAQLTDERGGIPPSTPEKPTARFYNIRTLHEKGIEFETNIRAGAKPLPFKLRLTVPNEGADLWLEADTTNRAAEIGNFRLLDGFVLDTPQGVLAVADYCNGHIYPLNLSPFPRSWLTGDRLDMPWIGVTDLEKGSGYMLLLDTSDDAYIRMKKAAGYDQPLVAPEVGFKPSKGRFAYPRRIMFHFTPKGGYVALAKRYREYAKEKGLIVPFKEKRKKNANVARLFGAPDVWGDASLAFARQAKAAGVEKMLIHGRSSPDNVRAINKLGYLTSEYDNYTDLLPLKPGETISSNRAPIPEHVVLRRNGKRMTAWLTFDKKRQYMKRCPSFWIPAAKIVVPKIIAEYPFIGRFIDVTTAEGLYECYDREHPLTRSEKRECGVALESYVRSLGLVVGGEHGIWWGVPHMDYIEGMMSGGYYSWPAGHLKHPKSKEDEFTSPWGNKLGKWERYAKWGVGHEWRAPLWELVFHDCIVSTWYWGDASDWLLDAAPEVTPKKDAFNILYGTIPLLWANAGGSWIKDRATFLRTYRNTCKLHEQIAGEEMLSHEFLTDDHALQRTRFISGTEVVVNFGEKPQKVEVGNRSFTLPQNGFAVHGPKVTQYLALVGGKPVTHIQTPGYLFTNSQGGEITLRAKGENWLRIICGATKKKVVVNPKLISAEWDLMTTLLFALDSQGRRLETLPYKLVPGGIEIGPFEKEAIIDALCGERTNSAEITLNASAVQLSPKRPRQGERARITVAVHNLGWQAAKAKLSLYVDRQRDASRIAVKETAIEARGRTSLTFDFNTSPLDGTHRIIAVAQSLSNVPELCEMNNDASVEIKVQPNLALWHNRDRVTVDAGELDRFDEPVTLPMDFGPIMRKIRAKGPLDENSVRVLELDAGGKSKAFAPAQFDVADDFDGTTNPKGELCWILTGRTPAKTTRHFQILFRTGGGRKVFPAASMARKERSDSIDAAGYTARFTNGVITYLAPKVNGKEGKSFIQSMILSSRATGWTSEEGSLKRFEVEHDGPVRCVIHVRKELKAGVVYDKRYIFYPRRFDVDIAVNKQCGSLYSRAYYALAGQYEDDKGFRAKIDGRGGGEDTYGKNRNPRWYAVYADDWAHSCIALTPFEHLAYWDAGYMGGIGFVTSKLRDVRMSYVIHAGASSAKFAEKDCLLLTRPPKARLGDG